jgi:hypothetical protein
MTIEPAKHWDLRLSHFLRGFRAASDPPLAAVIQKRSLVRNANFARSSTTPALASRRIKFSVGTGNHVGKIRRMKTFEKVAPLELARLKLVNPGQPQHRDLTLGFLLITVKERHQAGLRVE